MDERGVRRLEYRFYILGLVRSWFFFEVKVELVYICVVEV